MNQSGFISNAVMREVSSFAEKLDTMNKEDLALFAIVYSSNEMGQAVDRSKRMEVLEQTLIQNFETFNAQMLAALCNNILFTNDPENVNFAHLLSNKRVRNRVKAWVQNNSFASMEQLINVCVALVNSVDDKDLVRKLQKGILERVNEVTPGQAVILARCFMTEGSKNFMQAMDRIIGNGVFELSADLQAEAL